MINIYTKAEVDDHLALLASHASAIQDAIDNKWDFGFNYTDGVQDLNKSKRIIEQEAEIGGDVLLILDDCGDTSNIEDWVESYDGLNPVDNQAYVKQGSHSMALGIDADLDAADRADWTNTQAQGNLSTYQHDWIYLWVYLPTLDYLAASGKALMYVIGNNTSNYKSMEWVKTNLQNGWNLLKMDIDNPSGSGGTIDWFDISYQAFRVYTITGNTYDFTVYVDPIMFVRPYG